MTTTGASGDDSSAEWFDAITQGVLTIRRCSRCGHRGRPDAMSCSRCQSDQLEWVPAAGRGVVVSSIIDHQHDLPIPLALVELDEGPWLNVRLTNPCSVGDPVLLAIEQSSVTGGEPIPGFRPLC